jgi:predicted nucleotidyltransferase
MNPSRANLDLPQNWLADLCHRYHASRLSLFGSVLHDGFTADSDIDVLVEFDPNSEVGYLAMMRMQEELTERLGRQVDLRTPAELSRHFRGQVHHEARVLYPNPISEPAAGEDILPGEYPIWSPYGAHRAAAILMRLLQEEQVSTALG